MNIPSGNVWISEMELVELFGVIAPTLRAAIRAICMSGMLNPATTQRYDLATPAIWATFYNLEVVIALAFRLNAYEVKRNGIEGFSCTKRVESIYDFIGV